MASKLSIINLALVSLQVDPVQNLTDTKQGRAAAAVWDIALPEILRAHPWNFAVTSATLARTTDTPHNFSYNFAMPVDCLRVLSCSADNYRLEGRYLLTDDSSVTLRYVRQVEDPAEFDSLFSAALAALIGSYLAYPLTQSTTQEQLKMELYKQKLQQAKGVDAQEEPAEEFDESVLLARRY